MIAGVDRLTGFRRGLGEVFDPELVEVGDFTTRGGAEAVDRLLARAPDVDGVFVASDTMAIGAMGRLQSAGRSVPGDVAVVGFDDMGLAADAVPPLTTIRQNTVDQGRLMAQVMLERLGRTVPQRMPELDSGLGDAWILGVDLVVRQSA